MKKIFFAFLTIVFFSTLVVENSQAQTLTLGTLKCNETEGFLSCDNIYMNLGNKSISIGSMCAGQSVLIGKSYSFEGKITIELWDNDMFDPDDFLGSVVVSPWEKGTFTARFTEDGANYTLTLIVE